MCIRNNLTTRSRIVVVFPLLIHTYIHSNVFAVVNSEDYTITPPKLHSSRSMTGTLPDRGGDYSMYVLYVIIRPFQI